jgi:hypothetical protein
VGGGVGEPYDCTTTCACIDPKSGQVTARTDCANYQACLKGVCGCDDANGALDPNKTDCPQYAACQNNPPVPLNPTAYDFTGLPCLDQTVQSHDGRLLSVSTVH